MPTVCSSSLHRRLMSTLNTHTPTSHSLSALDPASTFKRSSGPRRRYPARPAILDTSDDIPSHPPSFPPLSLHHNGSRAKALLPSNASVFEEGESTYEPRLALKKSVKFPATGEWENLAIARLQDPKPTPRLCLPSPTTFDGPARPRVPFNPNERPHSYTPPSQKVEDRSKPTLGEALRSKDVNPLAALEPPKPPKQTRADILVPSRNFLSTITPSPASATTSVPTVRVFDGPARLSRYQNKRSGVSCHPPLAPEFPVGANFVLGGAIQDDVVRDSSRCSSDCCWVSGVRPCRLVTVGHDECLSA